VVLVRVVRRVRVEHVGAGLREHGIDHRDRVGAFRHPAVGEPAPSQLGAQVLGSHALLVVARHLVEAAASTVGHHQDRDLVARRGVSEQRPTTPQLDVVGVCPDCQHPSSAVSHVRALSQP
jgi:hypothetical protein